MAGKVEASGSVLSVGVGVGHVHRQHEVFEKKRRKVMPSGKPGLFIDRPSLLPSGRVTDGPNIGDLLVAEPFEEKQRGLFLGRGQSPSIELLVECRRKPVHQISSFASPAVGLCFGHCKPVFEVDRFSLHRSSMPQSD